MSFENIVRWLFVAPSDISTTPYLDSINGGRPVLTISIDDTSVQVTLDQVTLESGTSLNSLADRLDTHVTDIIVAICDSSKKQTKPMLEAILGLKNLPQSCFLCDTNIADERCLVIEQIASPYTSPGYSFHYIHVSNEDSDVLKSCLLRATKYCLRRRQIMLLNVQTICSEIHESTLQAPAETSSPIVSLSPSGAAPHVIRKTSDKVTNALNGMSPTFKPSSNIEPKSSDQSSNLKKSSALIAQQLSTHTQEITHQLEDTHASYVPTINTGMEEKIEDGQCDNIGEFDLPVDMGDGRQALFHGFVGQDPGEAMLKFMQKNNVSSRDYVMLYDKIKRLMIRNGYLSDESPPSPQTRKPADSDDRGKLMFSTNILFGPKKIKIDFYETDTSEEVAQRTVQSLGLGQNYEVFLRKKIDAICNSINKK